MIRGGVALVVSSRLGTANIPTLPNFGESKKLASILYIDANNLYVGIKLRYPLPLKYFELVTGITLNQILGTEDEWEIGYVVEVDTENPDELQDFPKISEKQPIESLELSDYQTEANNAFKVSAAKRYKLRQTFHPQQHNVAHTEI